MRHYYLPDHVKCYRTVGPWTNDEIPASFRAQHSLKANCWGRLTILKGYADFIWDDEPEHQAIRLEQGNSFTIPPIIVHRLHIVAPVRLELSFYRVAAES